MKRVVILGSTGSIGRNALKVVAEHPQAFEVVGLTAHASVDLLAEQARAVRPRRVAIADETQGKALTARLAGTGIPVDAGPDAVTAVAGMEDVDVVVVAITGAAALYPALAAIRRGRTIALANKETMVIAGHLVQAEAAAHRAPIVPVDSEHCAIFQCLNGRPARHVKRLLLTGSGGPLKEVPPAQFDALTREEVLNHPRWKMGPKISVDSATMMNKGLEVIEAHWLFEIPVRQIEIVIHPEAIVHSMVEFIDGSVLAQLGVTDMRIPIQHALTYPDRLPTTLPSLDFAELGRLTFERPNPSKFPCLQFGYAAAETGGTAPAVLNASNEACVGAFLAGRISFTNIPKTIETVLSHHRSIPRPTLDDVVAADRWAREESVRRWGNGEGAG